MGPWRGMTQRELQVGRGSGKGIRTETQPEKGFPTLLIFSSPVMPPATHTSHPPHPPHHPRHAARCHGDVIWSRGAVRAVRGPRHRIQRALLGNCTQLLDRILMNFPANLQIIVTICIWGWGLITVVV